MDFRARSDFTPVDISRIMARIVPRLVSAVTESCAIVSSEAQALAPVDTGALRESIHTGTVELVGTVVSGSVVASAPYAGYVEYGTGVRGASSAGAGVGPYNPSWPGQPAQPYLRPALDNSQGKITDAFATEGFKR